MPSNPSIPYLARGLVAAHNTYGASKSSPLLPRCILFIVQDPERNIFDQKLIEYEVRESAISIFRLVFPQVLQHTHIVEDGARQLVYVPPHAPYTPYEVTVVYYRAGYSPKEYPSETAWAARLHLERSAAIKCPSVLTHLAGSKKIQQVLATPSSPDLDRFLQSTPDWADRIRATFTNIYPLDESAAGLEARRLALDPETAQRYVLKPQREGGGNNVYRGSIPSFLRSIPEAHWKGYILMEIIEPPALRNSILRNGVVQEGEVIGELGVFGVCLWRQPQQQQQQQSDQDQPVDDENVERTGNEKSGGGAGNIEILENFQAGYVLRTKGRESEEGGIAAGYGCVDSCYLVDV